MQAFGLVISVWNGIKLDSWDHTGEKALKQNKGTQTQRQLDEWETEFHWSSWRTRFHIISTMTTTLILRPLMGSEGLCIYSPPLQKGTWFCFVYWRQVNLQWQQCHYRKWQHPAGSQGWSGQGLWSQTAAKTPTTFIRACGECATTVTQVNWPWLVPLSCLHCILYYSQLHTVTFLRHTYWSCCCIRPHLFNEIIFK